MIDLFITPAIKPRPASVVHKIEPAEKGSRVDYFRAYHATNREKRLKQMRENYRNNKAAYKARAKKWAKENPEKIRAIKAANQRRRRAR